jgi:hypothetical protein
LARWARGLARTAREPAVNIYLPTRIDPLLSQFLLSSSAGRGPPPPAATTKQAAGRHHDVGPPPERHLQSRPHPAGCRHPVYSSPFPEMQADAPGYDLRWAAGTPPPAVCVHQEKCARMRLFSASSGCSSIEDANSCFTRSTSTVQAHVQCYFVIVRCM